jgi:hypothetical protein
MTSTGTYCVCGRGDRQVGGVEWEALVDGLPNHAAATQWLREHHRHGFSHYQEFRIVHGGVGGQAVADFSRNPDFSLSEHQESGKVHFAE